MFFQLQKEKVLASPPYPFHSFPFFFILPVFWQSPLLQIKHRSPIDGGLTAPATCQHYKTSWGRRGLGTRDYPCWHSRAQQVFLLTLTVYTFVSLGSIWRSSVGKHGNHGWLIMFAKTLTEMWIYWFKPSFKKAMLACDTLHIKTTHDKDKM